MAHGSPLALREGTSAGYGDGKRALLTAAATIVAKKGLRALTHRTVSEEADVTHGLIRYYFGNRDELVKQALIFATEGSLSDTGMQYSISSIHELGKHLVDAVLVDISRQSFQYEMAVQSLRQPELTPAIRHINEEYRRAIGHHLEQVGLGGDPVLTNLVYTAFDGIVMELVTLGDAELAHATLDKLRDVLSAYLASMSK